MKKQKVLEISTNHPAFAGHFPGTPIVPGVVILDEVIQAITTDLDQDTTALQISTVKFVSPLRPGQPVVIEYEQVANTLKFEVLNGSRQIVIGSFVLKVQGSAI